MTIKLEKMLRALYGEEYALRQEEFENSFQATRDSCVEEAYKAALKYGYEGAALTRFVDDYCNGFAMGQRQMYEAILCLALGKKTEEELLAAGWSQRCVDKAKETIAELK